MNTHDEELRWRLELLKTKLDEGKIVFASHLLEDVRKSLAAVRYGRDGKIDLSTVDSRIRALSLTAAELGRRDAEKDAISLGDITNIYFEFVQANLGDFIHNAKSENFSAHELAQLVSEDSEAVSHYSPQIDGFLGVLEDFWKKAANASHYHIQDMPGLKAVYGGDLFPSYTRNIASTAGLYVDTIILSDPFLHSQQVFNTSDDKTRVYYLVKHAINLMKYRDLAIANSKNPIVLITPFKSFIDEAERKFLLSVSTQDAIKHGETMFGRKFDSVQELVEYGEELNSIEMAVKALSQPDRLLFDANWKEPIEEQILRALRSEWGSLMRDGHPGRMIIGHCLGRMTQATDILLKSRYLGGTPLIDAPTSWQYFNWKLEYNSAVDPTDHTHLHMMRGLQRAAETDAKWLGNIPPVALIEMREQGAFEEIRSVLSAGVDQIARTKPNSFFRSSDKIVENIQEAFERHQAEIDKLRRRKIKFAGYDLGSWLVSGSLELSAILTGVPTFGVAGLVANQVLDAPKLREIPERFRELRNAHIELKKAPMGLFFKHRE